MRPLHTDTDEAVERPVRRGDADDLVPVTGGQRVYATLTGGQDVYAVPGLWSAVVTNPTCDTTFRGDLAGGDQARQPQQQPDRMMKQAPERRWRMLNTLLSGVGIALAVVAMLRGTDTSAAPESRRAIVYAEQRPSNSPGQ